MALGGKVKFFFFACGAVYYSLEGVEKLTIVLDKWHSLYQSNEFASNYFRSSIQKMFHGVVRINSRQELAYELLKSRNLNISMKEIRNPYTYVLDMEKLNNQLSLPSNKTELLKFSPADLKMLKFISLANEEDVLRHNLTTVFNIALKQSSVEDLICFFSKVDLENFMLNGKECPSSLELQALLKTLIKSISSTEDGRIVLQRFINNESKALFHILQEIKSLNVDLRQIAMEQAFRETVIIEDTSARWLAEHRKLHPIMSFFGLTNEESLLKSYEIVIRKTILALLPKNPS